MHDFSRDNHHVQHEVDLQDQMVRTFQTEYAMLNAQAKWLVWQIRGLWVVIIILLLLLLFGCGGSGGGGDAEAASETLYLCSLEPELDEAVQRAILTIQERLTVDDWPDVTPRGMISAQRTVTHEAIHAAANRIDHVEATGNIMHVHHAPRERVLGDEDVSYLSGARDVAYTDDMHVCEVDVMRGDVEALGCPERATGCWKGEHIVLNARYRWHLP